MASLMVIIRPAGRGTPAGPTSAMSQETAKKYLEGVMTNKPGRSPGGSLVTNLSQAMNQAFNDQGKSNGSLKYEGHDTFHASAGVAGVSSVTLFYYLVGTTIHLFAMGEHAGSSSYSISTFGPPTGSFKFGSKVAL